MVKVGRRKWKLRMMSHEEYDRYKEQVKRSEGFDVHLPPGVKVCDIIGPVRRRKDMKQYSRLAIKEYNLRSKPVTPRLKFVKVLKAMAKKSCCVARFYITFEAKEEDSAGGKTKTYQAVVNKPPPGMYISVLSLRECEQEQGSSNICGKEWLWKGHTL